jgi:hypothetical protein
MNVRDTVLALPEVYSVSVKDVYIYGEPATEVIAILETGQYVTGTFTKEDKSAFGGVEFSQRKDPGALMVAKIKSVLKGTADES